jgi:tetrahedral aminopeptidase
MIELTPFLKSLISAPGLTGHETPVHDLIAGTWRPLVDELTTSPIGSLHGLRRGTGPEPRPRILLAGHMDAIGLIVTSVVDGLLRIYRVGGVDPRILPGTPVLVHGRRPLPGVVVIPPVSALKPELVNKPVPIEYLFVDTGLLPDEVKELVRTGDLVSFDQQPMDLAGDALAGHSLDDRAAVAAITACLDELQNINHAWDVYAVATVQEEETLGGALTSTFAIRPSMAIAIDVTFAKGPGANDHRTFPLGKGVALGWGPNIHPAIHTRFKELAEQLDVPYHFDAMPTQSGTDAMGTQITAEGIPSMVLSIPLRYMHTPVELITMKDISRTGHLMAQFIARLEPDFIDQIRWEE